MRKYFYLITIINILFVLSVVCPAMAGEINTEQRGLRKIELSTEEREWIESKDHNHIVVGSFSEDVPFSYNYNGEIVGVIPDMIDIIFRKLDIACEVEFKLYPNDDSLYEALDNGEVDVIAPEYYGRFKLNETDSLKTRPFVAADMGVVYKKGMNLVDTKNIAVNTDHYADRYVNEYFSRISIVEANTTFDSVEKVINGEADCAIAHITALERGTKQFFESDELCITSLNEGCNVCLRVNEENEKLAGILDKGVALIGGREIGEIMISNISIPEAEENIVEAYIRRHYLVAILLAVLIVTFIIGFIIFNLFNTRHRKQRLQIVRQRDDIKQQQLKLSETQNRLSELNYVFEKAILKDACSYFRADLTENKMLHPIIEVVNGEERDYSGRFDSESTYDEIIERAAERYVDAEHKEEYKIFFSSVTLIRKYLSGKTIVEFECRIFSSVAGWHHRRYVTYLSRNSETGNVIALVVAYEEAEKENAERVKSLNSIVTTFADLYDSAFIADMDSEQSNTISFGTIGDSENDLIDRTDFVKGNYNDKIELIAKSYVIEEDRHRFRVDTEVGRIKERLLKKLSTTIEYRGIKEGKITHMRMTILPCKGEEASRAVIGIQNIEDEYQHECESKEALEHALRMSQEASDAKSRFLSNMSHEIRTPMNAIIGFATLAEAHIDNQKMVADYVTKINEASSRLLSIVDLLLDMKRIETGEVTSEERANLRSKYSGFDKKDDENDVEKLWKHNLDRMLDAELKGIKVLVVEDNEINREIAGELLGEMGISVICADCGEKALEIIGEAREGDIDLILMDIRMPGIDGYETTRRIRRMSGFASMLPIVAMTANAFDDDRKEALRAGMNDHLAKPVDIEKLRIVISGLMDDSLN